MYEICEWQWRWALQVNFTSIQLSEFGIHFTLIQLLEWRIWIVHEHLFYWFYVFPQWNLNSNSKHVQHSVKIQASAFCWCATFHSQSFVYCAERTELMLKVSETDKMESKERNGCVDEQWKDKASLAWSRQYKQINMWMWMPHKNTPNMNLTRTNKIEINSRTIMRKAMSEFIFYLL